MYQVSHKATEAVTTFSLIVQRHINPANPAIQYPATGQGTARAEARLREKAKRIRQEGKERAKNSARDPKTSDVEFIESEKHTLVRVLGQPVGTVVHQGDKVTLFDSSAREFSSRARLRDLKKAAVKLYTPEPQQKKSRQVRRRQARKGGAL